MHPAVSATGQTFLCCLYQKVCVPQTGGRTASAVDSWQLHVGLGQARTSARCQYRSGRRLLAACPELDSQEYRYASPERTASGRDPGAYPLGQYPLSIPQPATPPSEHAQPSEADTWLNTSDRRRPVVGPRVRGRLV